MSLLAEHDDLVVRYIGKPDKKLVIKPRESSCVFIDKRWALHVNDRVLLGYANKKLAEKEYKRLTDKFTTSCIEFRE